MIENHLEKRLMIFCCLSQSSVFFELGVENVHYIACIYNATLSSSPSDFLHVNKCFDSFDPFNF